MSYSSVAIRGQQFTVIFEFILMLLRPFMKSNQSDCFTVPSLNFELYKQQAHTTIRIIAGLFFFRVSGATAPLS